MVVDGQRLDQILRNLLENALKFSPGDEGVRVSAGARDGVLRLEVSDRGVGIAPDDLPLIFERFHQVGKVMTRENEGAGLGLYITKRLVEAMGGTIDVASTLGEGSAFTVTLPRAQPSDPQTITSPNGDRADPDRAEEGAPQAPAPSAATRP